MAKNWCAATRWLCFVLTTTGCAPHVNEPAAPERAGVASVARVEVSESVVVPSPSDAPAASDGTPALSAPSGVRLPVDESWLHAGIAGTGKRSYRGWAQVGKTDIGKGYLYFLEPLNEGRWLLVKSVDDAMVRILDVRTKRQVHTWSVSGLGPDEEHFVLPWTGGGSPKVLLGKADGVWLHAAETGEVVSRVSETPTGSARWSKDGKILVTVERAIPAQTSLVRFYERRNDDALALVAELPTTERVDGWDLSRDNRFLARNFYPSERITVVDLHTGATLLDAPVPRYSGAVEFSPDGRWLTVAGAGVKWFDLSNPSRRAEYSHFYNNVSDVEFSPSGDVLAATAYDGSVSLLKYAAGSNQLSRVHVLRHQKNTNVYAARFIGDGNMLVSSSGDRTVRFWSGKAPAAQNPPVFWKSPAAWQVHGGGDLPSRADELARNESKLPHQVSERHVPERLSRSPLPSRIGPGAYGCKITEIYRLRECTVELDAHGHTMLEFHEGNLLTLRGVLYDDGPVVRFEGWLTDAGVLGCNTCALQPLHAVFRGAGNAWQGLLFYKGHYDPLVASEIPAADVVIEDAIDRFPLKLVRK